MFDLSVAPAGVVADAGVVRLRSAVTGRIRKGQNPARPKGGRPRSGRLGRAAALVGVLPLAGELNRQGANAIATKSAGRRDRASETGRTSVELENLVANLSSKARATGQLTPRDARLILNFTYGGTVGQLESFEKAVKRYRKRWKAEGPPLMTAPDPKTICMCAHRHCAGPCRTWAPTPVPCLRLLAADRPWTLAAPCHPSEKTCVCRHVHCERCGVGASEHDPMIQPAYTLRIQLEQLALDRMWIGWLCPDCMPPDMKAAAGLTEQKSLKHPACPRCGGDVECVAGRFRCAGLDGASNRLRTATEIRERIKDKLLAAAGPASRAEHAAFRKQQRALLDTLPETFPAIGPCGRDGPVTDLVSEQHWRLRPGRPK
jgi:hypothetical protein